MRSISVYPAIARERAAEILHEHDIDPGVDPLTSAQGENRLLWGEFIEPLESPDWFPEELSPLESRLGWTPEWALEIWISGKVNGRTQLAAVVTDLLADGGLATNLNGDLLGSGPIRAEDF